MKVLKYGCGCGFQTADPQEAIAHTKKEGHKLAYGGNQALKKVTKTQRKTTT